MTTHRRAHPLALGDSLRGHPLPALVSNTRCTRHAASFDGTFQNRAYRFIHGGCRFHLDDTSTALHNSGRHIVHTVPEHRDIGDFILTRHPNDGIRPEEAFQEK